MNSSRAGCALRKGSLNHQARRSAETLRSPTLIPSTMGPPSPAVRSQPARAWVVLLRVGNGLHISTGRRILLLEKNGCLGAVKVVDLAALGATIQVAL